MQIVHTGRNCSVGFPRGTGMIKYHDVEHNIVRSQHIPSSPPDSSNGSLEYYWELMLCKLPSLN